MIPSWNCAGETVSYAAITELLQQHGVKTSRARVAEYGRIVLEGGKKRKRRKRAKTTPASMSRLRLKVRQPWPQNPRRPRSAGSSHEQRPSRQQKKILPTRHADRTLPT